MKKVNDLYDYLINSLDELNSNNMITSVSNGIVNSFQGEDNSNFSLTYQANLHIIEYVGEIIDIQYAILQWLSVNQPYSSSKPIRYSIENSINKPTSIELQLTLSEIIKIDDHQTKKSCLDPNLTRNLLPKQNWDFTIKRTEKSNETEEHNDIATENDEEKPSLAQRPVIIVVDDNDENTSSSQKPNTPVSNNEEKPLAAQRPVIIVVDDDNEENTSSSQKPTTPISNDQEKPLTAQRPFIKVFNDEQL